MQPAISYCSLHFAPQRQPWQYTMLQPHVPPLLDDIPDLCLQTRPLQPTHCQGASARSSVREEGGEVCKKKNWEPCSITLEKTGNNSSERTGSSCVQSSAEAPGINHNCDWLRMMILRLRSHPLYVKLHMVGEGTCDMTS